MESLAAPSHLATSSPPCHSAFHVTLETTIGACPVAEVRGQTTSSPQTARGAGDSRGAGDTLTPSRQLVRAWVSLGGAAGAFCGRRCTLCPLAPITPKQHCLKDP